ncbi:MAG: hypothetical protein IJ067_08165 [Prevotella sp.]|nr:hypothetical protein [Prevotella sp.]
MRHRMRIIRMLMALGAIMLTAVLNWQGDNFAIERQKAQDFYSVETLMSPQKHHHLEATLTDATSLYRVCSSRPQRILSTQGSKTERTANHFGFFRRNIVKPIQFLHDSRRRLETSPFSLSASCHYYVIALRHILR